MRSTSCNCCNKFLTDPRSIERGLGPVCFAKSVKDLFDKEEERQEDMFPEKLTAEKVYELSTMEEITLSGTFDTREVKVDGHVLFPGASQAARNHSPDGFNWGYGGSGPAQLALGILLDLTRNKNVALALYQAFKWKHIATLPQEDFKVKIDVSAFFRESFEEFPDLIAGGGE